MNHPPARTSPLTAFFFGLFGLGIATVAATAAIVLYGMRIVDKAANDVLDVTIRTIEDVPALIDALPPTVVQLAGRRDPDYRKNVEVNVDLVPAYRGTGSRPTLTITNKGEEVISLMTVRAAALDQGGLPRAEWTEVVATPLAIDGDWRGVLMPGDTRYLLMSGRCLEGSGVSDLTLNVEVSELRLWQEELPQVNQAKHVEAQSP